MSGPEDIVGHKTFDTGELNPETGFPLLRHEPLTRAEADALWEAAKAEETDRATRMPNEQSAIRAMFSAWLRLKELGWREAVYCPKDGSSFQVIEPGSTGIFPCHYRGNWPNGSWWIEEDGGTPSRPVLFKLYPEDQAREDARMAAERERYKLEIGTRVNEELPNAR